MTINAFTSIVESILRLIHTFDGVIFGLYPTKEIVLAGDKEDTLMQGWSALSQSFLPQAVVLFNDGSKRNNFGQIAPYVEGQKRRQ